MYGARKGVRHNVSAISMQRWSLTCQQSNAFGVVGQRESIEHLDLVDDIAVAAVEADITRERRCLTTDVNYARDPGGGQ